MKSRIRRIALLFVLPTLGALAQPIDSLHSPLRTIDEVLLRNDSLIVRGAVYSIEMQRSSNFSFAVLPGLSQLNGDVNDGATFPGAERPWLWTVNLPLFFRAAQWEFPILGETDLLIRGGLQFNRIQGSYPGYAVKNWVTNIYAAVELDFLHFAGLEFPVQPFVYAGPGYLWHSPNVENVSDAYRGTRQYQDGTGDRSVSFLLGAGLCWRVSDRFDVLASYEKTLTFTDDLDHYVSGRNDNIAGLTLGVRIAFSSPQADTIANFYESASHFPPPAMPARCGLLDRIAADCAPWRSRPTQQFTDSESRNYRALEKRDSDGDGLNDAVELHIYGTNPGETDSDLDGLSDLDEIVGAVVRDEIGAVDLCGAPGMTVRRLRELLAEPGGKRLVITNPASRDSDQDGIDDRTELCYVHTDPCRYDTDGDGLGDYLECFSATSDPRKADSDGDGLNDCEEMLLHKTNPLLADTDFDGISDSADVHGGTNPDRVEAPSACREGMYLDQGILFSSGSWDLESGMEQRLARMYEFLFRNPGATIEIVGYADADPIRDRDVRRTSARHGERGPNLELSDRRARAVANWFAGRRIPMHRLTVFGGGQLPGEREEEKRRNRRVEVRVIRCR